MNRHRTDGARVSSVTKVYGTGKNVWADGEKRTGGYLPVDPSDALTLGTEHLQKGVGAQTREREAGGGGDGDGEDHISYFVFLKSESTFVQPESIGVYYLAYFFSGVEEQYSGCFILTCHLTFAPPPPRPCFHWPNERHSSYRLCRLWMAYSPTDQTELWWAKGRCLGAAEGKDNGNSSVVVKRPGKNGRSSSNERWAGFAREWGTLKYLQVPSVSSLMYLLCPEYVYFGELEVFFPSRENCTTQTGARRMRCESVYGRACRIHRCLLLGHLSSSSQSVSRGF